MPRRRCLVNVMTADRPGAEKMYKDLTAVDENWLKIRKIVVQKRPKKSIQGFSYKLTRSRAKMAA